MLAGYGLELQITFDFVCDTCGKRHPIPEDSDWSICCGKPMRMQPMRQFVPYKLKSREAENE